MASLSSQVILRHTIPEPYQWASAGLSMTKISRFRISGLHGYRDIDIPIRDNRIVLVGENGAGKTAVLRLLAGALTCDWALLGVHKFDSLLLTMDGKDYPITKDDAEVGRELQRASRLVDYAESDEPIKQIHANFQTLYRGAILDEKQWGALEEFCKKYDIMTMAVHEEVRDMRALLRKKPHFRDLMIAVSKAGVKTLYLPTYRRIESGTDHFVDDPDLYRLRRIRRRDTAISVSELIELGMPDVKKLMDKRLDQLKDYAIERVNKLVRKHLEDIITEAYSEADRKRINTLSEKDIKEVLRRIPEDVLHEENRKRLRESIGVLQEGKKEWGDREKVMCHYFLEFQKFQLDLTSKEESIVSFCGVCNRYLWGKALHYDAENFKIPIRLAEGGKQVTLEDLSSGEKQIVSIFCRLYLSEENFFVVIDEPELSLSVPWQEMFLLDISDSDYCDGLVAATHSPFVYQNNTLNGYTHGLGEYSS